MAYTSSNHCNSEYIDFRAGNFEKFECHTSDHSHGINIDLHQCRPRGPVIWGYVYDVNGQPLEGSLIQLVRCEECHSMQSPMIGQTRSDCNGYYELELPVQYKGNYRLLVNTCVKTQSVRQKRRNCICYY